MEREPGDQGEMLTTAEVAARLRVSEESVRRWIRRGEIHAVKLSGRAGWRVDRHEVERFLRERRT